MNLDDDMLLALLCLRRGLVDRARLKALRVRQSEQARERGARAPLGQLLTQAKALSAQDYVELREAMRACRQRCGGCKRPFTLLPGPATTRRCLRCGAKHTRVTPAQRPPRPAVSDQDHTDSVRREALSSKIAAKAQQSPRVPEQIGPYRIRDYVASGGMGVIYRAIHPEGLGDVALKVLRGNCSADVVERFRRESEAEARLQHPNIVEVYDIGETDDGLHYFTMELIEGAPLDQLLARPYELETIVGLLAKIAHGLDYAHDNGIIHRDMKPANVLVTRDGVPKITDFGLARDLGQSSLSLEGDIIGTPLYMSPEQLDGRLGRVDRRTDVFALGVILFQVLTRRLPFPARNLHDLNKLLLHSPTPQPSAVAPGIPEGLEAICLKALSKNPALRYQTARDCALELEAWLSGDRQTLSVEQRALLAAPARVEDPKIAAERHSSHLRMIAAGSLALASLMFLVALLGASGSATRATERERAAERAASSDRLRAELLELSAARTSALTRAKLDPLRALPELEGLATLCDQTRAQLAARGDLPGDLEEGWELERQRCLLALVEQGLRAEPRTPRDEVAALLRSLPPTAQLADQEALARAILELAHGDPTRALSSFHSLLHRGFEPTRRTLDSPLRRRALLGRARAHLDSGEATFGAEDLRRLCASLEEPGAGDELSALECRLELAEALRANGRSAEGRRELLRVGKDAKQPSLQLRTMLLEARYDSSHGALTSERAEDLLRRAEREAAARPIGVEPETSNSAEARGLRALLALRRGERELAKRALDLALSSLTKARAATLKHGHAQRRRDALRARLYLLRSELQRREPSDQALEQSLGLARSDLSRAQSFARGPLSARVELASARLAYLRGGHEESLAQLARLRARGRDVEPLQRAVGRLLEARVRRALGDLKQAYAALTDGAKPPLAWRVERYELRLLGVEAKLENSALSALPNGPRVDRLRAAVLIDALPRPELQSPPVDPPDQGLTPRQRALRVDAEETLDRALRYAPNDPLIRHLLSRLGKGARRPEASPVKPAAPDLGDESHGALALEPEAWDPLADALWFRRLRRVTPGTKLEAAKLDFAVVNLLGARWTAALNAR